MNSLNYIGTIVKLLEIPSFIQLINLNQKEKKEFSFETIQSLSFITFRVQLPGCQTLSIATLNVWGSLLYKVIEDYKVGDYFLIEGHVNMKFVDMENYSKNNILINVEKIFPISSNYFNHEQFI